MIMRAKHAAKFVRIQYDTLRDNRISITARGILAYMLTMADDWAFSVNGLAQALGISRPTLIKYVKELQAAGYIEIKEDRNKAGQITGKAWTVYEIPQSHSKENQSTEILTTASHSQKNQTTEKPYYGFFDTKNEHYKELTNIRTNKSNSTTRTRTREKFTPPTLEEVTAYCLERKNNVDPQRWLDHYQSNGWRVGKNPMKDWKAAVRTWERSGFNDTPRKPTPTHPAKAEESKIDEALRIALQRAEGGAV